MNDIANLVLVLAIGTAGWKLAERLGIPAAPIVGSMLAVGAVRLAGLGLGDVPGFVKQAFQIGIGMVVGLSFTPDTIRELKTLLIPAALTSFWMLMTGIAAGFLLLRATDWDVMTAFFAASPGGLAEMGGIAMTFGADGATVVLMQLSRLVAIVLILPLFLRRYEKTKEREHGL